MRGADEVIISVLKKGPKTRKELRDECMRVHGLSYPTYNRHLNKLIKLGEVKETKYELIEKEREAAPEDVAECINILKSSRREEVRIHRAEQLARLCRFRATHVPGLLNFLETSLNDPNEEVREQLLSALHRIIEVERTRKPVDERNLQRIIENNIETVKRLVSEDSSIKLHKEALDFFRLSGDERALDPIFEMIKTSDDQVYSEIRVDLAAALFWSRKSWLFRNHKHKIGRKIDELLADPIEAIRNRAKDLLEVKKEFQQ